MAKGCQKCKKTECEECPEWIFTFADLVMLMMGFFVILWVLKPNPTNEGKSAEADQDWIKIAAQIREEFGHIPDPNSKDPVDIQMIMQKIQGIKPAVGPGQGGDTKLKKQGAEGTDPEVTTIRTGKQAAVGGRLLFDPGDAKLTKDALAMLEQIANQIRGHRQIVMIKGHASLDDFADGGTPEKLMDVSIRRAQAVADFLTSKGVEPDILRVQGCSTFEPVAQHRYTTSSHANNRRVEVEVTATLVGELQDQRRPSKTDDKPAADDHGKSSHDKPADHGAAGHDKPAHH